MQRMLRLAIVVLSVAGCNRENNIADGGADLAVEDLQNDQSTPDLTAPSDLVEYDLVEYDASLACAKVKALSFAPPILLPFTGVEQPLAIADFNQDGAADLAIVVSGPWFVDILQNKGNGVFAKPQPYSDEDQIRGMKVADVDGDGHLDITVGANAANVIFGNGDGSFSSPYIYPPDAECLTLADLNGDGRPDIATCTGMAIGVLINLGNRMFAPATMYQQPHYQGAIAAADMNGDGRTDLVAADQNGNLGVLLSMGNGKFATPVTYPLAVLGAAGRDLALADLNGDGKVDVAVADLQSDVEVFLNSGQNGALKDPIAYPAGNNPYSIAVGDMNCDGKPDLVDVNHAEDTVSVLLNDGDGTFPAPFVVATGGTFSQGLALGDLNGDGLLDFAVTNQNSQDVSLLMNTSK